MRQNLINPEKSYTFSDYFKMRISTDDVLKYFGYSKKNERLKLPKYDKEISSLKNLSENIEEVLIHISLESEITRREFLIAPIMFEVRHLTKAKLNSEYWFEYNHQLKGSLDYLLRNNLNLLVVEAKNADLTRGFTQLSVEMVAIDKADEKEQKEIYGAVTTGREWQFGKLDREKKLFSQDINTYTIPNNLEEIIRSLVGILEKK
ncbi:MAG: hypothetical protein MUC29_01665 [Pyrinomonadaceae bacterium]|jgi:hypothetical protein|nr:hypothetical protein [Pyrinomonadaceae bacterium]